MGRTPVGLPSYANHGPRNYGKATFREKARPLVLFQLTSKTSASGGCIDVDQYPLDHKLLIQKIRKLKLPLVVTRSKSGGGALFFCSPQSG